MGGFGNNMNTNIGGGPGMGNDWNNSGFGSQQAP